MSLNVKYDKNLKLAAVGPSPWPKLGPEKWFDNYTIVVSDSFGYKSDFVIELPRKVTDLRILKTEDLVNSENFISLANSKLKDYQLLTYKKTALPEKIHNSRFISNKEHFADYEDKKIFRDMFSKKLNIPPYVMYSASQLLEDTKLKWQETVELLGDFIVLQSELSSGGKGTYIIKTFGEFKKICVILADELGDEEVIISKHVTGIERSVQVFVSKDAIINGPLQQQLVRSSELQDINDMETMHFCGGRIIDADENSNVTSKSIQKQVDIASHTLQKEGYRGMFGLDMIVTESGEVYVIEINARTTGMLTLLNEQETPNPLYLLHILEMSGEPYKVSDAVPITTSENRPKSFVTLFNKHTEKSYLEDIQTGNYMFDNDGNLKLVSDNCRWSEQADILIHLYSSKQNGAYHDQKLCEVFYKHNLFEDRGKLTKRGKSIVKTLEKSIVQN